jgi:hypothetical protein
VSTQIERLVWLNQFHAERLASGKMLLHHVSPFELVNAYASSAWTLRYELLWARVPQFVPAALARLWGP